ncbi:hypothetical protein ILYODFUR_003014 [Ilyodon furcidens]|uniref:Uncharacterized protein n=1 Tax=Ilyodon furcidens TaxID=33524 RepID=A0ABV0USI1_9TELE
MNAALLWKAIQQIYERQKDQVRAQPRRLEAFHSSQSGEILKSTRCCGRTVERLMPLKAIPTQKANL